MLKRVLPPTGLVLEIASGSGQHVVHFARTFPALSWQPSDPDARARESISAWLLKEKLANVLPPIDLDVRKLPWRVPALAGIVCINMIHISPWSATTALFAGARRSLRESGVVYLYGPYRVEGRRTAPSNEAFDRSLRAQDSEWGLRNLSDVVAVANEEGFDLIETVDMPANNLSVVFRKRHERGAKAETTT